MILKPNRPVLAIITGHWVSLLGAWLVTTAAICWILALPSQVRGHVAHPYIGILLFVILPLIFLSGLALIPIGVYLSRRKLREGLVEVVEDRRTSIRRFVIFLAVTTAFNVLIGSQLTYRSVEHMETTQFCGATCHVMKPQFMAYQNSFHSRVLCVDCHVAPGASGWMQSKLSGTRQLMAVAFDNYARPVQPALESNRLVPSSETCEHCHSSTSGSTVRIRVIPNYKDDGPNTPSHTVLSIIAAGIHQAHAGPGVHVRYAATGSNRETIPWVERTNGITGATKAYVAAGAKLDEIAKLPKYDMQCVDCHNRPAHTFELPERAVNQAIAMGEIAAGLPYVKKESLELLRRKYRNQADIAGEITDALRQFYRAKYPAVMQARAADIDHSARALASIYTRNVFPDLNVTWGTYPNHLGHTDFPGCFRCHDESHAAPDGKTITQDCNSCHQMIAVDEASPEILKTLNLADRMGALQRHSFRDQEKAIQ